MKKGRFSQHIPHSWLGLGRNGYHHGVARGQVSRTGSVLKRKNGNRYVLFLEHRYATTHALEHLVRLSRAVAGFKNHPPSSRSTYTLMRKPNKRPNGRTEKTITFVLSFEFRSIDFTGHYRHFYPPLGRFSRARLGRQRAQDAGFAFSDHRGGATGARASRSEPKSRSFMDSPLSRKQARQLPRSAAGSPSLGVRIS